MRRAKKSDNYIMSLVKSLALAFVITLLFFIIYAVVLTYSRMSEQTIPATNTVILIISIAVGSIHMTRKVHSKGWLNGAVVGVLYMILIILTSSLYNNQFCLDSYIVVKSLIGVFVGVISGIIGINLK